MTFLLILSFSTISCKVRAGGSSHENILQDFNEILVSTLISRRYAAMHPLPGGGGVLLFLPPLPEGGLRVLRERFFQMAIRVRWGLGHLPPPSE